MARSLTLLGDSVQVTVDSNGDLEVTAKASGASNLSVGNFVFPRSLSLLMSVNSGQPKTPQGEIGALRVGGVYLIREQDCHATVTVS